MKTLTDFFSICHVFFRGIPASDSPRVSLPEPERGVEGIVGDPVEHPVVVSDGVAIRMGSAMGSAHDVGDREELVLLPSEQLSVAVHYVRYELVAVQKSLDKSFHELRTIAAF